MASFHSNFGTRRRGVVAVFSVVIMLVLLGFATLTLDSGYMFGVHGEVQAAADSGALAGVSAFFETRVPTTQADVDEAFARAEQFATMNFAAQQQVLVPPGQIEIGRWSHLDRTFTALFGEDQIEGNAVRVLGSRHDVPYFFASIMGISQFDVDRDAVAHRVPICGGVWGLEWVDVTGDMTTDSYRSTDGPYDPAAFRHHGDVCSNGPIDVIGSSIVDGDASSGPGYEVVFTGHGQVTGASTPGATLLIVPAVALGDVAADNDNHTIGLTDDGRDPFQGGPEDLNLTGGFDNLTLEPGTYYFTSMRFVSQTTLTVTGPTTIYVTGDANLGGGTIVNATGNPHNLTIISTGSSFELKGGAGFYGSVMAPNTDISLIGNSEYFGQFVGRTMDVGGNAQIHIDETLPLLSRDPSAPFLVQ